MKKKLLVGIVVIVVLLAAGITWYARNRSTDNMSQDKSGTKQTVTKTGTFGCLKHSGDGPHTMECALGLHEDNGKQYALQADRSDAFAGINTDQKVTVTGQLDPTASPPNSSYETAGTITVQKIEKQ